MGGCWIRPAGCFEPGGKLRGCLLPAIVATTLANLERRRSFDLPWIREGEPADAVFNALAIVPMTGRLPGAMYDRPPFDVEESTRLIKKGYQAD
jgi:hypothetical protein